MNGLSLCAGIGGLDLALHDAVDGYRTVAYVEINPFCQEILCRCMDDGRLDRAPIWPDLHTFDGRAWQGLVDLVSAGFPCQPFSVAGRRRGADDERNLWPDVRRVIAESEPAIPLRQDCLRRQKSARRTSGNGSLSWATAKAGARLWLTLDVPNGGRAMRPGQTRTGVLPDGRKAQVGLPNQAKLWATPKSRDWRSAEGPSGDWRNSPDLNGQVSRSGLLAQPSGSGGPTSLPDGPPSPPLWPTPNTRDYHAVGSGSNPAARSLSLSTIAQKKWQIGQPKAMLNPRFVLWLMGFPLDWLD